MAKIEAAIKETITRGARRQIRQATGPLRREVRRLRQVVAQLRQGLAALQNVAVQWQHANRATPWRPQVSEQEAEAARLSPRLIQKLRTRLGLSQAALAQLVGVSAAAVVQWERGRSTPSGRNRGALVALRKLGRRDVKRVLAGLSEKTARKPARRGRKPRKARTPSRARAKRR